MNKLIIALTLILLTGCGGAISSKILQAAEELCKPNGGISYIWYRLRYRVVCNNEAIFNSDTVYTQIEKNKK